MQEPYLNYQYREATINDLELIWEKNIAENIGDDRYIAWKMQFIENNKTGKCKTFVVLFENEPIGQGTLLFSPKCEAIQGRTELADGINITNVNALRIEKAHEGKGYISRLVCLMEQYAIKEGYKTITIGVEARETRNLAIYLHWGYDKFIKSEIEDGELVLYYSKTLLNERS